MAMAATNTNEGAMSMDGPGYEGPIDYAYPN